MVKKDYRKEFHCNHMYSIDEVPSKMVNCTKCDSELRRMVMGLMSLCEKCKILYPSERLEVFVDSDTLIHFSLSNEWPSYMKHQNPY